MGRGEVRGVREVAQTFLGGDFEAGGHRQPVPCHLGEISALAADDHLVAGEGLLVPHAGSKDVDVR